MEATICKSPPSFGIGARGMCVQELQRALGLEADGVYGVCTRDAVARYQRRIGVPLAGNAGKLEFEELRIRWPDEFTRCLALVACWEGTGFGGCNTTDIDGAGFTFGIAGFTTSSGEVQALLRQFLAAEPTAYAALDEPCRSQLRRLISTQTSRDAWERLFFRSDGVVQPPIRRAIAGWGEMPAMRDAQISATRRLFWEPALRAAEELGWRSMAGRGLMFDTLVQNGGWRPAHQRLYRTAAGSNTSEPLRLAAAAGAVASCALPRWRADVLSRKSVFARGDGIVHGTRYTLSAQGFE